MKDFAPRIIILAAVQVGLVLFYDDAPSSMSSDYVTLVLLAALAAVTLYATAAEPTPRLRGVHIKHSSIMIFGILIVNFQYYFDYALGLSDLSRFDAVVREEILVKCVFISAMGLVSFIIGYLLSVQRRRRVRSKIESDGRAGLLLLKCLACAFIVTYFVFANPNYLYGGYGAHDVGRVAKYAALGFTGAVLAILLQVCRQALRVRAGFAGCVDVLRAGGWSTAAMVCAYLGGVLLSGDRGPLIILFMAYLFCYLRLAQSKVRLRYILLGVVCASLVISFMGVVRSFGELYSFQQKVQMAYQGERSLHDASISPATRELAGSVNVFHRAVDYVPAQHEYTHGLFQVKQVLFAAPFSANLFKGFPSSEGWQYTDLESFLTWVIQGDNPTYGNGGGIFADYYIAFGAVGVLVCMLLVGWVVRLLEVIMYAETRVPIILLAFSLVYFCNAIYIARSSFFDGIKLVLIVTVLAYMASISAVILRPAVVQKGGVDR